MKNIILFVCVALVNAKVDYSGHKVYRTYPNRVQTAILKEASKYFKLDIWSDASFVGDSVDFRVSPEIKARIDLFLIENRIQHDIFIDDLELVLSQQTSPRLEQTKLEDFIYDVYHTYDEIKSWMDNFSDANSMATVLNVGTGKSYENRTLRAIKISTGEKRPAFVINCGIHAREWISPATCLYTANQLVSEYKTDEHITKLMDGVDFYIIPTSNPDGYDYTWTTDRMWRKTRSTPEKNNCEKDCYGVDPNRNFNDHWNGSSTTEDCCSETYHGPSPFSEIETVNQKNFVGNITNVKAYIDIHSYGQLWMFPYGWTTAHPPNYDNLIKIGQDSIAAIKAVNGKTYVTGTIANTIYLATGSTADYFYDFTGVKCSFGAELRDEGQFGFALPEDQIIPTGEETFAGLMAIAESILSGKC